MYLVNLAYEKTAHVAPDSAISFPPSTETTYLHFESIDVISSIETLMFNTEEDLDNFFKKLGVSNYKEGSWCSALQANYTVIFIEGHGVVLNTGYSKAAEEILQRY